ncbi:exosortase-associated protein EpsI, B-type [Nitrosomonas ureae]|uniref:EpsI family protein n=1 Tax=Nitrosomonas ureae TaxID=44577 RepID=A0A0S3AM51_9PROT|nr:exosortase-associated protein EpsI, B-type [Nitrosomonas ureae]ALQ52257.1 methanolan biosynthesis protein EpsI [Nitrosomonas ureae]PTQ80226.1 EpsI family protein [Nitrosomonas ureae]PXX10168.1 EpsI family protein [Nitrosomonas ureae]SDU24054.1 EpsI family protein [Nitrosomonas ureae]SEQ35144.1 EpsI family protein [Nitrosomonas ureae]
MKKSLIVNILMGVLMISSGALTLALTPTQKIADQQERINLETMIPDRFGEWKIDKTIVPLQVDAETQAKLDKIYNQTLARTYVNSQGERIMLSVAYGGDQSDSLSIHKPEVCYYAQGFEIKKIFPGELLTQYGKLPIKRLLAIKGNRNEPITYWVTVGSKAVLPGFDQKLQQLRYGLTGSIPDGILVRISSIDNNNDVAYQLQAIFIQDLLLAVNVNERARLIGTFQT